MAGVINNAPRQIDLRGRRPGRHGTDAICRVTLNPGFNVVPDADLELVMKNRLNSALADERIITIGVVKRAKDEALEADVAKREAATHQLPKPRAAASLIPDDTGIRRTAPQEDALSL